ncbi:MAG: hypothetical protein ACYDDF_12635 [Thermoplasmatota archaeon]
MPTRVYEVDDIFRERLARDLADDKISRLSLYIRDASHFGVAKAVVYVILEGDDETLQRADAQILPYARTPEEAANILGWVRWEDEASALSVGQTFGEVPDVADPGRRHADHPLAKAMARTEALWGRFWNWLKA